MEINILTNEEASSSGFLEGCNVFMSSRLTDITPLTDDSKGGYCRLFKAVRMGKWCVLKCLRPECASNPEFIALLQKEFEISYKLSHPNIVQMIGMERIDGLGICILMEYIDGITLSEWIKTAKRSRNEMVHVMHAIGNALDYIHQQQIIHRDIKPSNILITRNGNYVKIIDFGLADADNYAILKQPAGTRRYIAPEQTEGKLTLDGRADIYSFGVILKETNKLLTHHSIRLGRIASKCCEEDREKRYSSLSEIKWENPYSNIWKIAAVCLLFFIPAVYMMVVTANVGEVNKNKISNLVSQVKHDSSTTNTPRKDTANISQPNINENNLENLEKQDDQQDAMTTANSKIEEQKKILSKLEPKIRKMTRESWEEYVLYLESCPDELVSEPSAHSFTTKVRDIQYIYRQRLENKIRALVNSNVPTSDPNYTIILENAQTISLNEDGALDNNRNCQKRMDNIIHKILAINNNSAEEQQSTSK